MLTEATARVLARSMPSVHNAMVDVLADDAVHAGLPQLLARIERELAPGERLSLQRDRAGTWSAHWFAPPTEYQKSRGQSGHGGTLIDALQELAKRL